MAMLIAYLDARLALILIQLVMANVTIAEMGSFSKVLNNVIIHQTKIALHANVQQIKK